MTLPVDPPIPSGSHPSAAEHETLRQALVDLRDELNQARIALDARPDAALREANARLVIAALRSDTIAEKALHDLSELALGSYRDVLTGTPNRLLMQDHLKAAMAFSRRAGTRFAVLFLDFDGFRQINRTLGHAAGDEVLRLGAQRLGSVIRETDTLSRHGGDEFLVLLTQLERSADAARVARDMLDALARPAEIGGQPVALSASIGIAIYPEDGGDIETVVRHADAAMYRAKNAGPGSFRFYRAGDTPESVSAAPAARQAVDDPVPMDDPTGRDLCEANSRLLITALQAQEQERQMREAQHQQMQFMAMVVHELRHPLTPLRLAADMLVDQDTHDATTMKSLQAIVDHQVTRLSRLIGDLLDGTRIRTGKLRVQHARMDLAAALRDAVDASRPLFALRHQTLHLELPPGCIESTGDALRLTQVFCNLLDNASKYSPEGGEATLRLAVQKEALVVTVTDTGIGIEADAQESIFGLFVQDDRGLVHSQGGLGIGLALARELVQAHGGTVTAQSAGHHQGSTFIVTLPRVRSSGETGAS